MGSSRDHHMCIYPGSFHPTEQRHTEMCFGVWSHRLLCAFLVTQQFLWLCIRGNGRQHKYEVVRPSGATVLVWMTDVFHSLGQLNTWLPVSGTVWEDLGGVVLWRKHAIGTGFESLKTIIQTVSSLFCLWFKTQAPSSSSYHVCPLLPPLQHHGL